MAGMVVWRLRGGSRAVIRCELDQRGETFRVRLLRGSDPEPVIEHVEKSRRAAQRSAASLYREFKRRGWTDVSPITPSPGARRSSLPRRHTN